MDKKHNYLLDLSPLGLIRISGDGAKKLLQGQLTCDLNEVSPVQFQLGALCNPQGRIISLFRIYFLDDNYYLQLRHDCIAITITTLKKYAIFFKVNIDDVSSNWNQFGLSGPDTENILKDFFPTFTPTQAVNFDKSLFIIKIPGKVMRYIILGQNSTIENYLPKFANLFTKASYTLWKDIDISFGIPDIYPETSEKLLPHEINLQQLHGISFTKGCYTGQEIIARMHYRAKLKNN